MDLNKGQWFKTGLIGTVITALCCFTPLLTVLFSALGIASILVYLDFLLIPLLVIFVIILIYSLTKVRKKYL